MHRRRTPGRRRPLGAFRESALIHNARSIQKPARHRDRRKQHERQSEHGRFDAAGNDRRLKHRRRGSGAKRIAGGDDPHGEAFASRVGLCRKLQRIAVSKAVRAAEKEAVAEPGDRERRGESRDGRAGRCRKTDRGGQHRGRRPPVEPVTDQNPECQRDQSERIGQAHRCARCLEARFKGFKKHTSMAFGMMRSLVS